MTTKAKTGWCCELCGRHLGGEMCENNKKEKEEKIRWQK